MAITTKTPMTDRARFLDSLERCAKSCEFIPTFYSNFMASSEEVRERFLHTDFDRQHRMLLNSLRLAGDAVAGDPLALKELRERGDTHGRYHLNIEPRLYELWLEALIRAAHQFDEHWDYEVEAAWRLVLAHVIRHMLKYY